MLSSFLTAAAAAFILHGLQSEASKLTPPVLPLIVRNPYLSTWLQDAREVPWSRWPMHWTGQEIGLSVLAAVPATDHVYPLLGRAHDSLLPADEGYNVSFPLYLGAQYDASTTNLTYRIPPPSTAADSDDLEIVLSFLSPITPTSTLRQSIPASYLTVYVKGSFNVDVYIDLNGQWVSGNRDSKVVWDLHQSELTKDNKGLKTWMVKRESEQLLTEWNDRAEWGTLHFSAPSDVRHEAGTSALLRTRFSRTGTLQNVVDGRHRSIMNEEPVFAFAKSFKLNESSSSTPMADSVLFTIAHIQDPVVQFASARGLTMMKPLWSSWFASDEDVLTFHYFDYENAATLATNYSSQLSLDAFESGADDYVDIVALSARQAMGACVFAGTKDDPILFMKEISSDGNTQTIDVIYPAFPFFLYTNPRWLAYLLEPLIEHTLSGQYPNKYAMHDLGTHFPNATGHPDGNDEYMPVEECGNILILGLALVNSLQYDTSDSAGSIWATIGSDAFDTYPESSAFSLNISSNGNTMFGLDDRWGGSTKGTKQAEKWVKKSYTLWKQWTEYLIEFTLEPHNQLSTDDFAGWLALQTNLALKGIIGINAMSAISEVIGESEDAKYYKNISDTYISKWEELGISRDGTHAKLAYDWYGSWTTLYNLYADSLLCFHLDDHSLSINQQPISLYGDDQKPLKPGHGKKPGFVPQHIYKMQSDWYHNSDWEFFAAAVTGEEVRGEILESVAKWVNETTTDRPFADLHKTEEDGGFPGPNFFARPVVGGHFAFLALEKACGGMAMKGLTFLNEPPVDRSDSRSFLITQIPAEEL
ncbi:hypothetical protein MMC17_000999 [Xylographa soralifera]|nr:hypothetical protein [Xylographa soralifera]